MAVPSDFECLRTLNTFLFIGRIKPAFPERPLPSLERHRMAKTQISLCIATCFFCASFITLVGCSSSSSVKAGNSGELTYENDAEKEQLLAGRPFHEAIANRDYEGAFALLSDYAKQDVSRRQVAQNLSLAEEKDLAQKPRIESLTLATFKEWMAKFEQVYGTPLEINEMAVDEMDPEILAGGGNAMDTAFSIGLISDNVPPEIRRSVIRSYITGRHTEKNAQFLMESEGLTEAEVHEYLEPQYEMKTVMVEIDGQLKVGHFEFFRSGD